MVFFQSIFCRFRMVLIFFICDSLLWLCLCVFIYALVFIMLGFQYFAKWGRNLEILIVGACCSFHLRRRLLFTCCFCIHSRYFPLILLNDVINFIVLILILICILLVSYYISLFFVWKVGAWKDKLLLCGDLFFKDFCRHGSYFRIRLQCLYLIYF